MPVNTPRGDYNTILAKWDRLRDCHAGRDAVIAAGVKYVPDLPGADGTQNETYRKRGNFYNALRRTVQGMGGALFQVAPAVEFPETLKPLLDNVTLTGMPFEMFANVTGSEALLVGRFGILVDMPAESTPGARPYLVAYRAESIINWRATRRAGVEVLALVVLKENVEVPKADDPFVNDVVLQFRTLQLIDNQCVVSVWRQKSKNEQEFTIIEGPNVLMRRGVPLTFIPFVFIGACSISADLEDPPLIDLADVNLGHWRNSVDHEYGLHLVALPTPWVAGMKAPTDASGNAEPLKIGPSVVWELDVQGSAGMLEFAGTGLGAIAEAMGAKVKQMGTLGARLFEDPVKGDTATAVLMRHSGEHATLKTLAQSVEMGLTAALRIEVWWVRTEATPEDVKDVNVEVNKEYTNVKASPQEVQVMLTALQAGEISFETWWDYLTTGGWGREGIDAAAERKSINEDTALEPQPDPSLEPNTGVV